MVPNLRPSDDKENDEILRFMQDVACLNSDCLTRRKTAGAVRESYKIHRIHCCKVSISLISVVQTVDFRDPQR